MQYNRSVMANDVPQKYSLRKITQDAKALGAELAKLLFDSPLPDEEKQAWAALVPFMTVEQLEQFRAMLLSHLERQVFDEAEDVILAIRAEELKRQFAHAQNLANANAGLDKIEAKIEALEGARKDE